VSRRVLTYLAYSDQTMLPRLQMFRHHHSFGAVQVADVAGDPIKIVSRPRLPLNHPKDQFLKLLRRLPSLDGPLTLEIGFQYKRNPPLCQRATVSGVTARKDCCHPDQNWRTATQKSLSNRSSLGRGCRRFRTASC